MYVSRVVYLNLTLMSWVRIDRMSNINTKYYF